jgi:hypothetical protein
MNATKQTNQEVAKVIFDKIATAKEQALSQALATGQITYDTYVKVIEPLVEAQMLLLQHFEGEQDWIRRTS